MRFKFVVQELYLCVINVYSKALPVTLFDLFLLLSVVTNFLGSTGGTYVVSKIILAIFNLFITKI